MDKGAHYVRADLQVHTPRDANWNGAAAVTPAERKAYAQELVRACRAQTVQAIAITDHHDLAFFPYVKAAAAEEVDALGEPVTLQDRLIVFPGIELTLSSPPCQAILLLDADFDETKFGDILTALAIEPIAEDASRLGSVNPISPEAVTSLNDLEKKLRQHKWLAGKFILLPNVTDGGHKSLLREGFHKHYKEMACVGGYVDGEYAAASDGMRNILEGRQQNNGYQPIGVFQTSDNRQRDHARLGNHVTWVKWSEPTTEALRQACLARQSRLAMVEPELPAFWINSLTVTNSKFLGRVLLEFNQQYNAIIGGRGTGKSTLLEYLRWGLCDQPVESDDVDVVQTKRKNLIDSTLWRFDGEVQVEFFLNDVRHVVKRNSKRQDILLRIGDGAVQTATEDEVRNLLPIQAYSQKQLSSVGVRVDELRRFVELPIQRELAEIRSGLRAAEAKIRATYGNLARLRELRIELARNDLEIASLATQLETMRGGLKGLADDDRTLIDQKALFEQEEADIAAIENELASVKEQAGALVAAIEGATIEMPEKDAPKLVNDELLARICAAAGTKLAEVKAAASALASLLDEAALAGLDAEIGRWSALKEAFEVKYEAAKARAQVNQRQLDQIAALEKRVGALKKRQTETRNAITALGDPEGTYATLREQWNELHRTKLTTLRTQCVKFSNLSDELIRAELTHGLHAARVVQGLKAALSGMNIKEEKLEKICDAVSGADDPLVAWTAILGEFERLAWHRADGGSDLPAVPQLRSCGFRDTELERITRTFDPVRWVELSLLELEFIPRFRYCTSKATGEYIEFEEASAGQQATALLTVLLNQQGAPLIIDQPEDDIDSRMIREIVEQVWRAKHKRQLIFASHNANFVVNGDAELVVCCDYVRGGDQTHGAVKAVGAIDKKEIKEEIILVTEGGRLAFKLRMEQYGF